MLRLEDVFDTIVTHTKHKSETTVQEINYKKELLSRFQNSGSLHNAWLDVILNLSPSKTTIAYPLEEPTKIWRCEDRPPEITLCAVDGSQIYTDKHSSIRFFLINCGEIVLQIGVHEPAILRNIPNLYFSENTNVHIQDIFNSDEDVMIRKISNFRSVEELNALCKLAKNHTKEHRPVVAIADGTLICWTMKNETNSKIMYINALRQFRECAVPVISYISFPATHDCTNGLARIFNEERFEMIHDRTFWGMILELGERSAVFESRSEVQSDYENQDRICFCYLKGEKEISRIEFPKWVHTQNVLPWVCSVVLNEIKHGKGYPRILREAHAQAVVSANEASSLKLLIERTYSKYAVEFQKSEKAFSKENNFI